MNDGKKDPSLRGNQTVLREVALRVLDRMNRMSRMLTGPVSLRILFILSILSKESVGRLWCKSRIGMGSWSTIATQLTPSRRLPELG